MRLLFVTTAPPWPPRRGYQLRAASLAERLAGSHEVRVLASRPPGFPLVAPPAGIGLRVVEGGLGAQARGLLGALRMPLQVALYRQGALRRALRAELLGFRPEVVVLVLSRLGFLAEAVAATPLVVDLVDSLGLNMARRAEREGLLRPLFAWEARRMARWERRLVARAAAATVVSERDRRAVAGSEPALLERLETVPLGLELPSEPPPTEPPPTGPALTEPVVLLSGNLGYFPTVDGALWLAREVWPRVRERVPEARWWLAGARPAKVLRGLDGREGIRLWPSPDDLGALRRRARVAVAPLLAGSGTPIKVLEAMADGVPVVTTPQAAGGLDGLSGDELAIAGEAAAFAERIVELLADAELRERRRRAAFAWLRARHELGAVTRRFEEVLAGVIR